MGIETAIIAGSAIAAGGGIGAAALSKPKGVTKQQEAAELEALREQGEIARAQEARSKELYEIGQPAYKKVLDFYTKRAENPYKYAIPDIEQVSRGTYAAERQLRQDTPVGGGLSQAISQNRLSLGQAAGDITRATRDNAYTNLAGLASTGISGGQNSLAQAASTVGSLLPAKQQNYPSQLPAAFNSAGNAVGSVLTYWLMNRKTG